MEARSLIARMASKEADPVFAGLYGADAVPAARARWTALAEAAAAAFPEAARGMRAFTAAGRTELGGNHTDHNRGRVVAASIQLDAAALAAPRDDKKAVFRSAGYPDVVVDLGDLEPRPEEKGTTEALLRGVAHGLAVRGIPVRGFAANAASTVLPGSGLSSSAAMECLFGVILDGLFGGGKLDPVLIAKIGQEAENVYFGKPCGLMDQVACASGGAVAIDFRDPAAPAVERIPFAPEAAGYALYVVDTGGSHADLTDDYAAVPAEMRAVAAALGKEVLREAARADVEARAADLRKALGDRAVLRALHFFDEDERADAMRKALEDLAASGPGRADAAMESFLALVRASGSSSWRLLQNVSTPKAPKEQGIALAVALTESFLRDRAGGRGACRVHGGGFAGTVQAYVPVSAAAEYEVRMGAAFGPGAAKRLRVRPVGAAEVLF